MRNNRVFLIKKHNVRCTRIIIFHWGGGYCRGFIPNALVIFSCHQYDQTLNFLFTKKIACKNYHHLLLRYTEGPVLFVRTVLPGGRWQNIIILSYKWLTPSHLPEHFTGQKGLQPLYVSYFCMWNMFLWVSVQQEDQRKKEKKTKEKNSNTILSYHKLNNITQSIKLHNVTQITHRKWKHLGKKTVTTQPLSFHGLLYCNWQTTWHVVSVTIPGNW
jgi:hypothetical protein